MICFYCDEKIEPSSDVMLIPIESPYTNLFVHRNTCFREIQAYGEHKFLMENSEKIIEYAKQISNGKGK